MHIGNLKDACCPRCSWRLARTPAASNSRYSREGAVVTFACPRCQTEGVADLKSERYLELCLVVPPADFAQRVPVLP
jgi:hypothetical protein